MLLALRAANDEVVNARSCDEEGVDGGGSMVVGIAEGGGAGGDAALTLPLDVNIESSKSCLVACWSSTLPSSGDIVRSCCPCGGGTGPGSGLFRNELRKELGLKDAAGVISELSGNTAAEVSAEASSVFGLTDLRIESALTTFTISTSGLERTSLVVETAGASSFRVAALCFFSENAVASFNIAEALLDAESSWRSMLEVLAARFDVAFFVVVLASSVFFASRLFTTLEASDELSMISSCSGAFVGAFRDLVFFTGWVVLFMQMSAAPSSTTTFFDLLGFLIVVSADILSVPIPDHRSMARRKVSRNSKEDAFRRVEAEWGSEIRRRWGSGVGRR